MPSSLPSTGLIADYTFDEGSGSVLHDRSGNGNDATFPGSNAPAWESGGLRFIGQQGLPLPVPLDNVRTVLALATIPAATLGPISNYSGFLPFVGSDASSNQYQFWFQSLPGQGGRQTGDFIGYPGPTIGQTGASAPNTFLVPGVASLVGWSIPASGQVRFMAEGVEGLDYRFPFSGDGSVGTRAGNLVIGSGNGFGVKIPDPGILIRRLAILSTSPVPSTLAGYWSTIAADATALGTVLNGPNPDTANILVADGDSITFGFPFGDGDYGNTWLPKTAASLSPPYQCFNYGISGQGIDGIDQFWDLRRRGRLVGAGRNIATIFAGTNNLAGISNPNDSRIAAAYDKMQSVVAKAVANGYHVVVIPMLSRTGSDVAKNAYNALLANIGGPRVTFLPPSSIASLTADGAYQNETLFSDGTHLTAAGNTALAAALTPVANGINFGTPITPGTISFGTPGQTSVNVNLTGTSGGQPPLSIQFQRAPDASGSPGTWTNVGTAGLSTATTLTGLTANTSYWARAIVTDANNGTATTQAAKVTTASAPAPVAVYPTPDKVMAGTTYGPTGTDYIGTLTGGGGSGTTIQEIRVELDARGLTQEWAEQQDQARKWGPTNRQKQVKTSPTGGRIDLYGDDGTTIESTQPYTDDGQGNATVGAQT